MVSTILDGVAAVRMWGMLMLAAAGACRGEPPRPPVASDIQRMVDSLAPLIEDAVGLPYKEPPVSGLRSRDDVRRYIIAKLNQELPPQKLAGVQEAYRLFGLLPDTLELGPVITDLLSQQVVGFFDPDSAMLFVVEGSDPVQVRLVVAHELVHALQGQYLPLASMLASKGDNDLSTAIQSTLEGQANYASLVLFAGAATVSSPSFWEEVRRASESATGTLPPGLPLLLKEWLLFPYLGGGEFMQWWETSALADTVPFGGRMPVSTEQILHPARYLAGDIPVPMAFTDSTPDVMYQDNLGEFEIRILLATRTGRNTLNSALALGWGGDRYRVYRTPSGSALVWYSVWDDARSASRFRDRLGQAVGNSDRPGYRTRLDDIRIDGRDAIRVVIAPEGWTAWPDLPAARILPPR